MLIQASRKAAAGFPSAGTAVAAGAQPITRRRTAGQTCFLVILGFVFNVKERR